VSRRDEALFRRRRRTAAGVLIALVALVAIALEDALGDDRAGPHPREIERMYLSAVPDRALVGQMLMVRMEGSATPELLRGAREGEIGGVILFPPPGQPEDELRAQVRRLQRAASDGGRPPLLVAIDQEGGEVKRLPQGPPDRSAPELAEGGDVAEASAAGRDTGRYLARLGINVDLAPVLDVPSSEASFMTSRAFGDEPRAVAELGGAFAEGLEAGGVIPTVKHFPGLGRAVANTDLGPSEVDASERELEDDVQPFREAIARRIPMVMVGNAIYGALDPEAPAALSRAVVTDLLRGDLGFEGVAISDDLGAGAIEAAASEREAAVAAARAGIDVLLYAGTDDPGEGREALRDALDRGELGRAIIERSLVRILELKERIGRSR
jgi:beta-N-acetylhexosaminidase